MSGMFSVAEIRRYGLFLRGGAIIGGICQEILSGREGGFGAGEKSSNLTKWLINSRDKILANNLKVAVSSTPLT